MNFENDPLAIKAQIQQRRHAIDVLKGTLTPPPKGITANSIKRIHDQIFDHEYHIADLEVLLRAYELRTQASQAPATQRTSNRTLEGAHVWRGLHDEFKALAAEELTKDPGNKNDRWLRAHVSGDKTTDKYLNISNGVDEGFRARFDAMATRAGIALGKPPGDVTPLEFWIRSLFLNLLEHKSQELFAATRERGGIIKRVCEASAIYCARLEKTAAEIGLATEVPKKKRAPRPKPSCFGAAVALLKKSPEISLVQFCRSMDSKAEQFSNSHKCRPPESWKVRTFYEQYQKRSNTVSRFLSAARKASQSD